MRPEDFDGGEQQFLPAVQDRHFQDQALIQETAEQVQKDFGLFDIRIHFSGTYDSPYDELSAELVPHIQEMLEKDMGGLYALLYQIDIPEKWWKRIREDMPASTMAHTITDAILQRELLKVITRNHFRQRRMEGERDA